MKTIVMIGKADELTKGVDDLLHRYFRVQLCTEDPRHALGMVKVVSPDMVVINLAGFNGLDHAVFARLQQEFTNIPVLTLGTVEEYRLFEQYYRSGQFRNLPRPVDSAQVLSTVCTGLGLDLNELKGEKTAPKDGKKTVLVVDDNAATLRSIKAMLDRQFNVTLANSGMKALTAIGKERPDVILLDYEMPVCDGRQTLEMIRADEDIRDIPVIFLTSVNDKEHIQAVIKLLPAGYLLKPAVPGKLILAIEKALEDAKR
jgi:CheY-like chemotaxis protein